MDDLFTVFLTVIALTVIVGVPISLCMRSTVISKTSTQERNG